MGQGPFGQPPVVDVRVDYARASSQVSLPAIFMMVLAGLTILFQLLTLALHLFGTSLGALAPGSHGADERMFMMFSGAMGVAMALVNIAANAVILYGAMQMKNLQSYTFALVATILNLIPCSCCCLLSLPVGIWSLVVLLDNNVKAAFSS